jgi:hypothetical protein
MQIRHLLIERFRGILKLDWSPDGSFISLIGPGDSCKSTILDAIELALSPRWNLTFDDTDFYNSDHSECFRIVVTVGDLPDTLKSEQKYGLSVRGWSPASGLHDEPEDGDELVLSIQLKVDSSLEPVWTVVNDRKLEKQISARDRETIGIARLGVFQDRHLSWGRGSLLSRITGKADELPGILAQIGRDARRALNPAGLTRCYDVANLVQGLGEDFGVLAKSDYRPGLDTTAVSVGIGGLALHEGEIPLKKAGVGTKRLLSLAIQNDLIDEGAITLIDEVEHGLEPHRLRRLLNLLRQGPATLEGGNAVHEFKPAQVILTTHSPVALAHLKAEELRVVRNDSGRVEVICVSPDLQDTARSASEAFLSRKVIVCEGKTELGFCWALDEWWADKKQLPSFALLGVVPTTGGGSKKAPKAALDFAMLGFKTSLFADSDDDLNPDRETLEKVGINVFQWSDSVAIEEKIALDLPWQGLVEVLEMAVSIKGVDSVCDSVRASMRVTVAELDNDFTNWPAWTRRHELRRAIGYTAKKNSWFKRPDFGQELGQIVCRHLDSIPGTELAQTINALRTWVEE